MSWVHAVGLYALIGVFIFGLGILVKKHWGRSGLEKTRGIPFTVGAVIGAAIGVLLWPLVLGAVGIAWKIKRKTRKVERLLGYCEHMTVWEPYCDQCRGDIEREESSKREITLGDKAYPGLEKPLPPKEP